MTRAPAIFLLACLAVWLLLVAVLVASSITANSVWWLHAFLWVALICVLAIAVTLAFGKKHPQLVDRLILVPAFIYLLGFPLLAIIALIMVGDEHVSLVIYREGGRGFLHPIRRNAGSTASIRTEEQKPRVAHWRASHGHFVCCWWRD